MTTKELKDGRLDDLENIKLLNFITILSCRGDGEVEAECEQCGKVFVMKLTPIEPFVTERTLPCGCVAKINPLEQNCAQMLVNTQVSLIGQTSSPDKHRRALCRCEKDGNFFRARFEAIQKGRVRSCGCMQAEQMKLNRSESGKNTKILGTDLVQLRRKDDTPIATNTSGHTGVWYDKSRNKWVAEIHLQGRKIFKRFDRIEDAILCRTELKELHQQVLMWWESLTPEERTTAIAEYADKSDARQKVIQDMVDKLYYENSKL